MQGLALVGWIALAGAIGTICRYTLSGFVQQVCGQSFPWGTFAVNMLGCFLFGLIWPLAEERMGISPHVRMIVLTGFLGSLTTFSSYAFETTSLMRQADWMPALANVATQNVLGIVCVLIGFATSRLL